jgi:2-methylfumaryl-CoA hydratase
MTGSAKTSEGNFFEDFRLGQELRHAVPRTVTSGDVALYMALTGSRFALASSDAFARQLGLPQAPLDDLLVFHLVFGRTVPDISLNAIANLGYAQGRFGAPVYPGDTLTATSTVIGLKENSNRQTGVVYVHSVGRNQRGAMVVDYVRWVLVRKRDPQSPAPAPVVPELVSSVPASALEVGGDLDLAHFDPVVTGSSHYWEDYEPGERIDHVDGMTIEESCHMTATRLYQNNARVHFNQHAEKDGRFGRRIVYGGHIISLARALSVNGLGNALKLLAINGGRHTNPSFAGDTIFAWSEGLAKAALPGHAHAGALRLRLVATKNRPAAGFPDKGADGNPDPAVVLDFDYWALLPRKQES